MCSSDLIPGKTFPGHVIEIGNTAILRSTGLAASQSAISSQEAKDFKVVVALDNPPDEDQAALGNGNNGLVVRRPGGKGLRSGLVRLTNIPDGSSNTILVGEKRMRPDKLGTAQANDDQGYTAGWDRDEVVWGIQPPQQDLPGQNGDYQFGSAHAGAFNALFADGSVRRIS